MINGQILHLQRLSTEDGPGIRTTVFFKGCPLQCSWCHNPESISPQTQLQWFYARCLGCGSCVEVCPEPCLTLTEDGIHIDRETCTLCGACTQACPTGALETIGKTVSVDEILAEVEKDRAFYEQSGGGVTLSGGEPTFQPEFCKALLRGLRERGIHTALDTCGLTSERILEELLPFTDLLLFDIKLANPILHREYTGQNNIRILENLTFVRDTIKHHPKQIDLWIRTPLIPGATDTEQNLIDISRFISENMEDTISRWDLCAFNNLCRDQYARLGLDWVFSKTPLMTQEDLTRCEKFARSELSMPDIVQVTGAFRAPEMI